MHRCFECNQPVIPFVAFQETKGRISTQLTLLLHDSGDIACDPAVPKKVWIATYNPMYKERKHNVS